MKVVQFVRADGLTLSEYTPRRNARSIRKELVEELADVLMYYNDVLLCYGISAEELKEVYSEKCKRNMNRW